MIIVVCTGTIELFEYRIYKSYRQTCQSFTLCNIQPLNSLINFQLLRFAAKAITEIIKTTIEDRVWGNLSYAIHADTSQVIFFCFQFGIWLFIHWNASSYVLLYFCATSSNPLNLYNCLKGCGYWNVPVRKKCLKRCIICPVCGELKSRIVISTSLKSAISGQMYVCL